MAPAVAASSAEQGVAAQPQIQLGKTPAGWQEKPPGGMSTASFAIFRGWWAQGRVFGNGLSGAGVAELDLINIVRQDAGLPALQETEFSRLIEKVDVGQEKGALIDFTRRDQFDKHRLLRSRHARHASASGHHHVFQTRR